MKKMINDRFRLPSSVGIGDNRLVAKMAANMCKPDGLLHLTPKLAERRFAPLDVDKMVGIGEATKKALNELEKIRINEGENIQSDLMMRLGIIKKIVDEIRTISELNRDVTLERYKKKMQRLVEDISVDESRLFQEAAILSEKKDITEELVRLDSHIDLFENYIDSSENKGKKLNFILQEMSREINTIGSKTDVIKISHMVVDMKDELEKIREQVQNIV